jgi:hypothetical protein
MGTVPSLGNKVIERCNESKSSESNYKMLSILQKSLFPEEAHGIQRGKITCLKNRAQHRGAGTGSRVGKVQGRK